MNNEINVRVDRILGDSKETTRNGYRIFKADNGNVYFYGPDNNILATIQSGHLDTIDGPKGLIAHLDELRTREERSDDQIGPNKLGVAEEIQVLLRVIEG